MGACGSALDALDDELHQDDNLARDAASVFRLIDDDKSGTLSTEEFGENLRMLEPNLYVRQETQRMGVHLPDQPNRSGGRDS